eukprot:138070-Prorocentrum_minimum.AAC.1
MLQFAVAPARSLVLLKSPPRPEGAPTLIAVHVPQLRPVAAPEEAPSAQDPLPRVRRRSPSVRGVLLVLRIPSIAHLSDLDEYEFIPVPQRLHTLVELEDNSQPRILPLPGLHGPRLLLVGQQIHCMQLRASKSFLQPPSEEPCAVSVAGGEADAGPAGERGARGAGGGNVQSHRGLAELLQGCVRARGARAEHALPPPWYATQRTAGVVADIASSDSVEASVENNTGSCESIGKACARTAAGSCAKGGRLGPNTDTVASFVAECAADAARVC